ncbi:4a-hydroxytetrahydrobiopterin dehydratase [soil metagenome]
MQSLVEQRCVACEGGVPAMDSTAIDKHLAQVSNWQLSSNQKEISREFKFKNFYHTMAFVNAIAWVANQENHHPDLEVGYNRCLVRFTTHAIDGLSVNDFICAAKVDVLLLGK